jgi:hypothetical protein
MLDELRTWWQNTTPEMRGYLQDGGLVVAALLGGYFLGSVVARGLRAKNFDAALRLGGPAPGADAERGFTPTVVAALLVRLTVWAAAGWWLARQHGHPDWANTIALVLSRTWAVVSVFVAALALGGLLARRLVECLGGLSGPGEAAGQARYGAAAPSRGAAGAAAAVVYVLSLLLVLLMATDMFGWPLTRTAALALWQFAQHLLVAGAALLIGSLGARWARDLVTAEAASPERRAGQLTGLVIVAATTVLAVVVLLSTAGVLLGLAALAAFGGLLWLGRGHLPDVSAGLQLRAHKIREVWLEGEPWQVAEIGLLTSQVGRRGEFRPLPNRVVLEARLHAAPPEAPSANGPVEARHR